jgi:hypothetical protein
MPQTNQRVYEWRNGFGSSALAIVNAFLDHHEEFNSDDARAEFAETQLTDLAFLYEKATGEDKTVTKFQLIISVLTACLFVDIPRLIPCPDNRTDLRNPLCCNLRRCEGADAPWR